MGGSAWEVWDSVSGNLIFEGTEAETMAMLRNLHQRDLAGLTAGRADDSQVWHASQLVDHG